MKKPLKEYIIRKYVKASSIADAIKRERKQAPDDIWLDEDWRKHNAEKECEKTAGFKHKKRK